VTSFDLAAAYREVSTAYAVLGLFARCEELRRLDREDADEAPAS
jgi:hypothetical protein